MMSDLPLDIPRDKLEALCKKWKITELALFGSVLREDFGPDSDVDVLVVFADDAERSYFEWPSIQQDLSELFGGRDVDLLTRNGVRHSRNKWKKHEILSNAQKIYPAA